jgi:putative membrane protein
MLASIALMADTNAWHDGHHWILFPLFWLIVIAIAITLFRRRGFGGRWSARTILAERFARGEISAEEYRERLGQL